MPTRKKKPSGGAIPPAPVNFNTDEASRTPTLQPKLVKPAEPTQTKDEPIQPYHIFVVGEPEFEAAIAKAPKFSELRNKLEQYYMDYMLKVLQSFNFDDCHKAYTTETMEYTCFVYVTSQLVERLENEIENITKKDESLGYIFLSKPAEIVIAELKRYIEYFEDNDTGWNRINIDFIEAITN